MRNLLFFLTALILSACNLTAPGSPVELATPTGEIVQATPDLLTANDFTPAAQTDWVTYTNPQNGYTLQRPSSVSLVEEQDGDAVYIDDQIEITVSDINPEEARGDVGMGADETTDVMVGSYPARNIKGSIGSIGGGTPQTIEQVIVPHNDHFYIFTVYELKRSAWTGEVTRSLGEIPASELELFNSILTTMRFEG